MRSLHIIGSKSLGGAESFYSRFVTALAQEPDQDVVCMTRPKAEVRHTLPASVTHIAAAMFAKWDVLSMVRIRRVIREKRPDIIQTYMGRATRLTRPEKRPGSVHVARLGGFYKVDGYFRHADAWVGNSPALCDYLKNEGLPSSRIHCIGNFMDPPEATPQSSLQALRASLSVPDDAFVLFALGRLIPKKGFSDLLVAFAALPTSVHGRPLYLMIAGDGPMRSTLVKGAEDYGIADRARWVGWQTQVTPYFHMSDLLVCPSHDEPLGNVILEAWAHGLPVLATDTVGARHLIRHSENGICVDRNNPAMMAEAILSLVKAGSGPLDEMSRNGTEELHARHSRRTVVDSYMDMYSKLTGTG